MRTWGKLFTYEAVCGDECKETEFILTFENVTLLKDFGGHAEGAKFLVALMDTFIGTLTFYDENTELTGEEAGLIG